MEDLLKWALTTDAVSPTGLLLVNLIALAVGLHRKWLVPGWIYLDSVAERTELAKVVKIRNDEDRATINELKDQIGSLTALLVDQEAAEESPTRRHTRRPRRDGA